MIIIERMTQEIYPNKWEELEEPDKKHTVVEERLGFPPKKRYRHVTGGLFSIIIIERQWESMAVFEATCEKAFLDPELQKLNADQIVASTKIDLFTPLP